VDLAGTYNFDFILCEKGQWKWQGIWVVYLLNLGKIKQSFS
jgi:hypothetical protein